MEFCTIGVARRGGIWERIELVNNVADFQFQRHRPSFLVRQVLVIGTLFFQFESANAGFELFNRIVFFRNRLAGTGFSVGHAHPTGNRPEENPTNGMIVSGGAISRSRIGPCALRGRRGQGSARNGELWFR